MSAYTRDELRFGLDLDKTDVGEALGSARMLLKQTFTNFMTHAQNVHIGGEFHQLGRIMPLIGEVRVTQGLCYLLPLSAPGVCLPRVGTVSVGGIVKLPGWKLGKELASFVREDESGGQVLIPGVGSVEAPVKVFCYKVKTVPVGTFALFFGPAQTPAIQLPTSFKVGGYKDNRPEWCNGTLRLPQDVLKTEEDEEKLSKTKEEEKQLIPLRGRQGNVGPSQGRRGRSLSPVEESKYEREPRSGGERSGQLVKKEPIEECVAKARESKHCQVWRSMAVSNTL